MVKYYCKDHGFSDKCVCQQCNKECQPMYEAKSILPVPLNAPLGLIYQIRRPEKTNDATR